VFELPRAGQIVGRGFELAVHASPQIRSASIYFGGLLLAFVAPVLVLGLALWTAAPPQVLELLEVVTDPDLATDPLLTADQRQLMAGLPPDWLAASWLLFQVAAIAILGTTAVAVDGQAAAIVILAARHAGRRAGLRQALVRARQVFWRVVWASSLVTIPMQAGQITIISVLDAAGAPAEASALVALAIVTAVGAPFGYVAPCIVIGDVGPADAIRRSLGLARARWRLALMVAFFAAVFSSIQVFGLAAGVDLLIRIGGALGLGLTTDAVHQAATIGVLLAAIAAAGSLVFTVGALLATPQVVAFLGLTYYEGGLDRAETAAAGSFRWVTRPMVAGIAVGLLLAGIGGALLAGRL
jgi:hypothetical protein